MVDNDKHRMKRDSKTYEKLLDSAEKRRELEINLFWQRAYLFWVFTIAGLTAYAYFFTIPNPDYTIALLVACFGLVSSFIWTFVNRGSRFWQSYWEREISLVKSEAKYHRVMYLEFFDKPEKYEIMINKKWGSLEFWKKLWDGERFSPSRLMIALSDYIAISWVLIIISNIWVILYRFPQQSTVGYFALGFGAFTILYIICVYLITKHHHDDYIGDYA